MKGNKTVRTIFKILSTHILQYLFLKEICFEQ